MLSAEPLVGLKLTVPRGLRPHTRLSAEPLVGLKRIPTLDAEAVDALSAEPLVGLKPHTRNITDKKSKIFQPNPSWV